MLAAALLAATFLLAGGVKGLLGVGLPTVAMALLSLGMPPAQAAATLIIPALATNIWQMAAGPALFPLLKRFAFMAIGMVAGTFATIGLLTGTSTSLATAVLGSVLAAYGGYGLIGRAFRVSPRAERWLSPIVGFATGMVTGASGVYVVPVVPYLNSLGLDKEELVQSIGISAFVCPLALAAALALRGQYNAQVASSSFIALLPALAGMYLGQAARRKLRPAAFFRWFFGGLLVLGLYMIVRSAT
ncbi:MAG TPA: sulfite exporter TauE/SafE family protein [Burkholderiales bacterium]